MCRLFGAVALLAFALPAWAQFELVTIEKPIGSHHLAGVVVDSTGAPVPDVVVEECKVMFSPVQTRDSAGEPLRDVLHGDCGQESKNILASTATDAKGYFAFPKAKMGTTHYLHLEHYGFDPMQIKVKLRLFAKGNLHIRLHIAT
jgi:hypothetical protein